MNRVEYLSALDDSLKCLPEQERREALEFYCAYFEDGVESGKSEEQIIAELGSVQKVSARIISQSNFQAKSAASQAEFEQAQGKNSISRGIKGVLLAIGAVLIGLPGAVIIGIPVLAVLFGLLMAAFGIVLALVIVMIVVPAACIFAAVALFAALPAAGVGVLGWALMFIGFAILSGTLFCMAAYGVIRGITWLAGWILNSFGNLRRRKAGL